MFSTLQKAGVMGEFMSVKASLLPPIGVGYELDLPEIGIAYENKEKHDKLEHCKANFDVEEEQEDDCDRNPYTSYPIIEPQGGDEDVRETYLASIIENFRDEIAQGAKYHLGYPCNMEFDYTALEHLYHVPINNLGDPHVERNYGIHSKEFEIGVLDWFANLWDLEKDEYWGYVTCGGTEGNLHGLLIGRELFPDGILYASKDSHYSVYKAAGMYRMQLEKVDCLIKGQMNCKDFRRKLVQNKGKPAIVVVNIGTTVKGAIDDLDMIIKILEESGYDHDRFYIHCDAALFGLIMPFAKGAPKISFKKPIGSVSVSGHKFVGTPTTCGVQITKMEYINSLKREESFNCTDATIIDSRDGHASMFLWYTLNKKGYRGIQKDVQRCLQNAQYLKDRLWSSRISVMLNEPSIIVVFEKPGDENFIQKWQLACQGNIAHVIVMQNVTNEKLDSFVHELIENRPKWLVDGKTPCIANEIGNENCFCSQHGHI